MGLGLTLRGKGVSHGFGVDVKGEGGCLMGLGLTLRGKGVSHGFGTITISIILIYFYK